ncbi:hypothetical protein SORBI_3003G118750 [Sorghum bicolor]|uniref:Uncharacterized protein n=1 Tax=Sorghum bicolor TaxID=4558 RepID=A0A1W0VWY9_SORBI|nr:hypothetical protein SORBI_3003G118750 [Sorghum bicolor]
MSIFFLPLLKVCVPLIHNNTIGYVGGCVHNKMCLYLAVHIFLCCYAYLFAKKKKEISCISNGTMEHIFFEDTFYFTNMLLAQVELEHKRALAAPNARSKLLKLEIRHG